MSTLDFRIEWEDPCGARGEELRATWARLEIVAGDGVITRLFDSKLNSVRNGVFVPLYPIAEWIVTNWWALLNECVTPTRQSSMLYGRRHNMRFAAEGFAMPWLEIRPVGKKLEIEWRQRDLREQRLQFIAFGAKRFDADSVGESLTQFVDRVVARLDQQGISGTGLQRDWKAIRSLAHEERDFCEASGALGLDPFNMDSSSSDAVMGAASLPARLQHDFFEAADPAAIADQLRWVEVGLECVRGQNKKLESLLRIKSKLAANTVEGAPHVRGYSLARQMLSELGIADREDIAISDLAGGDDVESVTVDQPMTGRGFEALVGTNSQASPGFVLRSGRKESRRFALCRAIYNFMSADSSEPSLVSTSRSDRQQGNRAFAAEFLAPSSLIRKHLAWKLVDQSEVQELAERFGVSEYVIAHQIQNHDLGELAEPVTAGLLD
jgi:hypothetical protein